MVTFKKRLPPSEDILVVLSFSAFCVFAWSIFNVLKEVPAWLLRLNTWDLIGIVAYTQMFALLETSLLVLTIVLIGMILPAQLLRDKFSALASAMIILTSAWMVLAHYNDHIFGSDNLRQLATWTGVYLVSLSVVYFFTARSRKIQQIVNAVGSRIMVLSFLYITVGILSAIVVVFRNII